MSKTLTPLMYTITFSFLYLKAGFKKESPGATVIKKMFFLLLVSISMQATLWKNWAKNQQCEVTLITPATSEELISLVAKARVEKATVHAYGTGHSWSDIVCVKNYLINTEKLNKIISANKEKNQVTVQAGIKLNDLNKQLAKLGLCLPNQGAITEQSLAGVVSTATHGSGKTGTYASFITQVKLLTADGNIITISSTENSDLFGAARTSLGCLGIMLEFTVQCEPMFRLKQSSQTIAWDRFLQEYNALLDTNDFMQGYWDIYTDSVRITMHNRVSDQLTAKKFLIPFMRSIDDSYKMLSGNISIKYMEEEIAIPKSKFVEAAKAARELMVEQSKKNVLFQGILFRFVSAEKDNVLSPAADQDVVFFSITTLTSQPNVYETFYKKFYDRMLAFDGRPHWGKINYLTQENAKKLYGQNYDAFVAIRKQLDPDGMFSNAFTKRIFGW